MILKTVLLSTNTIVESGFNNLPIRRVSYPIGDSIEVCNKRTGEPYYISGQSKRERTIIYINIMSILKSIFGGRKSAGQNNQESNQETAMSENKSQETAVENNQPTSSSPELEQEITSPESLDQSQESSDPKETHDKTQEPQEEKAPDVQEEKAPEGGKVQVHNLIIVDESGSMSGLREVTLSGINETIGTIRNAQKEYADTQEHYLTLVTFDDRGRGRDDVRTIINTAPIESVAEFTDYHPSGSTPLYDALGHSLTSLRGKIQGVERATAIVTVLTDGLENASIEWTARQVRQLIEQLKEEGWTFSYMGSAHDVKEVTDLLSIENVMEFRHDMMGAQSTWGRDRSSRMAYYRKLYEGNRLYLSMSEFKENLKKYNMEYISNRVTPNNIQTLEPNEVFVFGSNPQGNHAGGAARFAVEHFGAQMGVGEGIQGQSYAIPTTERLQMEDAIMRFCYYAHMHPEKKFLVTQVGCGIVGYAPEDVAPLFKMAIEIENICLPREFWEVFGLRFMD